MKSLSRLAPLASIPFVACMIAAIGTKAVLTVVKRGYRLAAG